MVEVSRFSCGDCKYHGDNCKCIDHTKVHFARSCFSCDEYTANHIPCYAYECVSYFPALRQEWEKIGNFWKWHELFITQWHNGKKPKTIDIILTRPTKEGREVFDDVWEVAYDDFLNCNIIKDNKIHYINYRHIEKTRKTPTGYHWINEGEGVLDLEALNAEG